MRNLRVLVAALGIVAGCALSLGQRVTETKMLADFEDGTCGVFDKGPVINGTKSERELS